MKKLIIILFTLMLLASCSNTNSKSSISNGSDVLFTSPKNISYTKGELYDNLKNSSTEAIENSVLKAIALKYDINMDDLDKQAQEFIDLYVSMGYENYLISYYGSLEAYKELYKESLIVDSLNKKYVDENFDELLKDDKPVKMQMAIFEKQEDAEKCISDVNNGTTFDTAALNNNATNTPATSIYKDSDPSLNLEVKSYLNSTNNVGLSSVIPYTTTMTGSDGSTSETTTYYVLNIESRDVNDFKDEYVELISVDLPTTDVRNYFFKKHKIEFFDQDLYEYMSKKYEVLK